MGKRQRGNSQGERETVKLLKIKETQTKQQWYVLFTYLIGNRRVILPTHHKVEENKGLRPLFVGMEHAAPSLEGKMTVSFWI